MGDTIWNSPTMHTFGSRACVFFGGWEETIESGKAPAWTGGKTRKTPHTDIYPGLQIKPKDIEQEGGNVACSLREMNEHDCNTIYGINRFDDNLSAQ